MFVLIMNIYIALFTDEIFLLRNTNIRLLIALLFNMYTCTDGKDAKPVLENFKKDYSSIIDACKAVGFVRDNCSTRGLYFASFLLFSNLF